MTTTGPQTMKAWVQTKYGGPEVLHVREVPIPTPEPHDLRVKVLGASINPVDFKMRSKQYSLAPDEETLKDDPLICGYDAAGVVDAVGSSVTLFKPGDEVYFSGVFNRPGANAEYTLVDERLVGRKPDNLAFPHAAAVPLCALTVWEALVEGMGIPVPKIGENLNANKNLLIIAGAGGIGSLASQVAKRILRIGTVISTASRPESAEYCKKMCADYTIDHSKDYAEELDRIGVPCVDYILNGVDAFQNIDQLSRIINPLGKICFITGTEKPLNLAPFFIKRVTFVLEMMFTRALFRLEMEKQHEILNRFAKWIEEGLIDPRVERTWDWSKLPEAHAFQESGRAIGKTVFVVKF